MAKQRGQLVGVVAVAGALLWLCGPLATRPGAPPAPDAGGRAGLLSDFVVSVVMRIELEPVAIFVRSWRAFSPSTQIVFFLVEEEVRQNPLLDRLLTTFDVDRLYFTLPPGYSVHVYRFMLYQQFIRSNGHRMRGLILSDMRDAVLQGDPWRDPQVAQLLHSNAMLFSLVGRDAPMRIQDEPHNRIWIVACFGTQVADALGPKGVSCSGMVIGAAAAVGAYVDQVAEVLHSVMPTNCTTIIGVDQGIHNYVLHHLGGQNRLRFAYRVLNNTQSPVYNMAVGMPAKLDPFQQVWLDDRRPPILHQYDRSPTLVKLYKQMYSIIEERVVDQT